MHYISQDKESCCIDNNAKRVIEDLLNKKITLVEMKRRDLENLDGKDITRTKEKKDTSFLNEMFNNIHNYSQTTLDSFLIKDSIDIYYQQRLFDDCRDCFYEFKLVYKPKKDNNILYFHLEKEYGVYYISYIGYTQFEDARF